VNDGFYVLNPKEAAWGFLPGVVGTLPDAVDRRAHPREVLEKLLLDALQHRPCGVAFSGGRDSSLVLAIATCVARREGLPDPVPITRVFPGLPDADESEWQELVIRHLGLGEWCRLSFHDEVDILSPTARDHLVEHGLVWPPALTASSPLYEQLAGGTLIDGEGGDEVLGVDTHRIAWIASLLLYPRPLRRWRIRAAVGSIAPRRIRARGVRSRQVADERPWLRPAAKAELDAELVRMQLDAPLSFAASVRQVPMRRGQLLANRSRELHARGFGVRLESPLLDSEFVHAIARLGGFVGPGDRTAVLRELASDLLPDVVLARLSKASFNNAYLGRYSVDFARRWSGHGLNDQLVDVARLRAEWLGSKPSAGTAALLQQAWLATEGSSHASGSLTG
jgi:asparagine synthetase B (glutamine-hydrolysing)